MQNVGLRTLVRGIRGLILAGFNYVISDIIVSGAHGYIYYPSTKTLFNLSSNKGPSGSEYSRVLGLLKDLLQSIEDLCSMHYHTLV